jgi:hypothetical protein
LTRLIKNYYHSVNEKSKLIIENILSERIRSITTIQTNIKRYLIQKDLRNIIKNGLTCYKLDYPFKAKGVKIKIFVNLYDRSIQKIYDFTFCRIRKIFVLYINPSELNSGKYRVLLVVDNIVTCDGRFPHIEFSDGHYYNIIDFKLDNDRLQTSDTEDRTKIYNEASEKSKYTISEGSDTCEYFRQSIDSPIDRNLISNLKNKAALSHFESLKRSIEEENYNFDL